MALYLVTGGAGFIGSHLAEGLVARGDKVRVIDNLESGKIENIKDFCNDIEFVEGDVRDKGTLEGAMADVDYVLHVAALRSVPRSVDDPFATNEVNVQGTLNVLWYAKEAGVRRVVFASSSSVYGMEERLPQREGGPLAPVSPYAVSKLAGEYYCSTFSSIYGLETVRLRYFNVFGPRQDPRSQYAAVVPIFISGGLNGEQVEVHGDGLQSRDFTYIANTVDATLLASTTPGISGQVFNIACGERHTILALIKTIEKFIGKDVKYVHTEARKGDIRHTMADINKSQKLMGYKPNVTFEEGLTKTVEWFKTHTS